MFLCVYVALVVVAVDAAVDAAADAGCCRPNMLFLPFVSL